MILNAKNTPAQIEDIDKDGEIKRLQSQIETLKNETGLTDHTLELKKIDWEHENARQLAIEAEKQRQVDIADKTRREKNEHIQQVFKEQLNKKIKAFRIHSDSRGRRAEFYTKLPITCPACGSDDIQTLRGVMTKTVEIFDDFQRDPIKMLEHPRNSICSPKLHCSGCETNFSCHIQITL